MNADFQAERRKKKAIEIGFMCKVYREKEHLSVRQIANKAGYLSQTVYAFERGKSNSTIILFDCYINQLNKQNQLNLIKGIKECLNNGR